MDQKIDLVEMPHNIWKPSIKGKVFWYLYHASSINISWQSRRSEMEGYFQNHDKHNEQLFNIVYNCICNYYHPTT